MDQPGITEFATRRQAQNPFIDAHGRDQQRAASVDLTNRGGTPYDELPAGQLYAKREDTGYHYPLAYDTVQSAVAGANVLEVADVRQFFVFDYVEVEGKGWRKITARDLAASTITVDGAALTLNGGETLEVDPSRSFTTISQTQAGVTTVNVADASVLQVGDTVQIGTPTVYVEFQTPGSADGEYRITVTIDGETYVSEYTANADTELAIVTALYDDLNAQIPAGKGTATLQDFGSTGTDNSVRVTLASTDSSLKYSSTDQFSAVDQYDTAQRSITAVDTGANTADVDDAVDVTDGDLVVSNPDGQYKISIHTIRLVDAWGRKPANAMFTYRPQGEARSSALTGLTPTAKAALMPLVTFNADL